MKLIETVMLDGERYCIVKDTKGEYHIKKDHLRYLLEEYDESNLDGLKATFRERWNTRYLNVEFNRRTYLWRLADNSEFEDGKEVDLKSIARYDSDRKWIAKALA